MSWKPHPLPPGASSGKLLIKFGVEQRTGRETMEALRIHDFGKLGTLKEHGVWSKDGTALHADSTHQRPKK